LSFQKAVDAFDLPTFMGQFRDTGADYLLFTAAHALQMLPAPHPGIDKILPGRTCQRDLIAELADALASRGKPLLVYYNHSCNQGQDRPWEQAVEHPQQDSLYLGRIAQPGQSLYVSRRPPSASQLAL
jgi:hypothetical protein